MLKDQFALETAPLGVLVHIGAGSGAALDGYLQAGFEHIYLIEPNPEFADILRSRIEALENVTHFPVAVAPENGRMPFKLLNFADLSSLRAPVSLTSLLPGIHITEEVPIEATTLDTLFSKIPEVPENKANWLVIEAPGAELDIVHALATTPLKHRFQTVVVQSSLEAYYEGGSCQKPVLQALQDAGYQLAESWLDLDPDWPHYLLRLDQVKLENTKLKEELAKAQSLSTELEARLDAAQSQHIAARSVFEQQLAEQGQELQTAYEQRDALEQQRTEEATRNAEACDALEQQLAARAQELQAAYEQRDALEQQCEQARADLQGANAQIQHVTTELRNRLDGAQTQHEQAQAQQAEAYGVLKQQSEARAQELNSLRTRLNEAKTQHQQEQTRLAEAFETAKEEYADQLQDIEETLKRDLAVALRLQALARSDQQELQARYAALQGEKARQDELLIKVTQKLGSAAKHLHQLAQQEPVEIAKAEPARKPVKRTSTRSKKKSRAK